MNKLNRTGIALVTGMAVTAIVVSQVAYAQGNSGGAPAFSALIGRSTIRASDPRFQPAAVLVMDEASASRPTLKGNWVISKYVMRDFFDKYVVQIPSRAARGTEPRPLTPSEALFLQELFSHDLQKVRDLEANENGIAGIVSPRDLGMKPEQLIEKAKARGKDMMQWYDKAAAGLGAGH